MSVCVCVCAHERVHVKLSGVGELGALTFGKCSLGFAPPLED